MNIESTNKNITDPNPKIESKQTYDYENGWFTSNNNQESKSTEPVEDVTQREQPRVRFPSGAEETKEEPEQEPEEEPTETDHDGLSDRSSLLGLSIFDTIELIGGGSKIHNIRVTVLHIDEPNIYVQANDTKELITINNENYPLLKGFVHYIHVKNSKTIVNEIIKEKDETEIVYLDETVYSVLFSYFKNRKNNVKTDVIEKTKQTFELMKWHQKQTNIDDIEKSDMESDENQENDCKTTPVKWELTFDTEKQSPFLFQLPKNYILQTPYIFPILDITKTKLPTSIDVNFLFTEQAKHLELKHVCSTLPLKSKDVTIVRTFQDEHREEKMECMKFESMPWLLKNSPLECEFKYKNIYRSSSITACTSGNDRLYYTSLSSKDNKSIIDKEFTRSLHYPLIKHYTSPTTDEIDITRYRVRKSDIRDNRFDDRIETTFLGNSKYTCIYVNPQRPIYFSLLTFINHSQQNLNEINPTMENNRVWKTVSNLDTFLKRTKIIHNHLDSTTKFTNTAQYHTLFSLYSIYDEQQYTPKVVNHINKQIKKTNTKLNTILKVDLKFASNLNDISKRYNSLFNHLIQTFIRKTQEELDYNDINKLISKQCPIIRKIDNKKSNILSFSKYTSKTNNNHKLESHHLYAWLYTLLNKLHERSTVFDHMSTINDFEPSNTTPSTIETLIETVLHKYNFSSRYLTPLYRSNNITIGDVRNIYYFDSLIHSHDSGKLYLQLLNSKSKFIYINKLKNNLLEFGEKRYNLIHQKANTSIGFEKQDFVDTEKKDISSEEDEKTQLHVWNSLREDEKLKYAPSKQFLREMYDVIIEPVFKTFQKMPKALCSKYKIVKMYNSIEDIENDTGIDVHADHNFVIARQLLNKIKHSLSTANKQAIDDDIFDELYTKVTLPKNALQHFVREGEYAKIIGTNILYQRTGGKWIKQEVDVNTIISDTQCPFNFNVVDSMDWSILSRHEQNIENTTLNTLCIYEDQIQECLPYPMYTLFQFMKKMFIRYTELSNIINTIESQYTEILDVMRESITMQSFTHKKGTDFIKKPKITPKVVSPEKIKLQLLLKNVHEANIFSDQILLESQKFIQYVSNYLDNDRQSEKWLYWSSTEEHTCRHWLDICSIMSNTKIQVDITVRTSDMSQFNKKWPSDKNGYCLNCGTNISKYVRNSSGSEWEQINDGKEAIETKSSVSTAEELPISISDHPPNTQFLNGLTWYSQTLGIQLSTKDKVEILKFFTNIALPSIKIRDYEEIRNDIFQNDDMGSKIETSYKSILDYTTKKNKDEYIFETDNDYIDFFNEKRNQLYGSRRNKKTNKKIKKIERFIQVLKYIQAEYHAYKEEQNMLMLICVLYIHMSLAIPNYTIRKKDTIAINSNIPLKLFNDFSEGDYSFIKTLCVFYYRLINTPSKIYTWPSKNTRIWIKNKIRKARVSTLEDTTIQLYYSKAVEYVKHMINLFPNFNTTFDMKKEFVLASTSDNQKYIFNNLKSFRPTQKPSKHSAAQTFMQEIQTKLNNAPLTKYALTSCVFPYVLDTSLNNPYIQSILPNHSFLKITEPSLNETNKRFLFVPNTGIYVTADFKLHTILEQHSTNYINTRYQRYIQSYTVNGLRRVYKTITVSPTLVLNEKYNEYMEDEELSTFYHPAIQEAIEYRNGHLQRDITHIDEPTFKSETLIPFNIDDFNYRLREFRIRRKIDRKKNVLYLPTHFNKQLLDLCKGINLFWTDDMLMNIVINIINNDDDDDDDTQTTKPFDINNSTKDLQKLGIIQGYLSESEACKNNQWLENNCVALFMSNNEDMKNKQYKKAIMLVIKCIKGIQQLIETCIRGDVWDSVYHSYYPVNPKNIPNGEKVDIVLNSLSMKIRCLNYITDDILKHVKVFHNEKFMKSPKGVSIQEAINITDSQMPSPSVFNTIDVSNFTLNESKYMYLLLMYILVNHIKRINLNTSVIDQNNLLNIQNICVNYIRDMVKVQNISSDDITNAKIYIDDKNNKSRVRSMETLKAKDPFLENSHHMFRAFNLGSLDHVKDDEASNDAVNSNVVNDEEIEEIEEGYDTMQIYDE